MTNEKQEQVERERLPILAEDDVNAGIHTFQRYLRGNSYTFTLNTYPDKIGEVEFGYKEVEVDGESKTPSDVKSYLILRYCNFRNSGGHSLRDIEHVFAGDKCSLVAHLRECTEKDRTKLIAEELEREKIWRDRK